MQSIFIPLSFFVVIVYTFRIYNRNPLILVLGSLFFIEMIWQFISIIWIDCGAYISEQLRYSYYTGASIRYTLLIMPFACLFPYLLDRNLKRKKITTVRLKFGSAKGISKRNLYILCLLAIGYLLTNVLISGAIPLFSHINYSRFYDQYSVLPFARIIYDYFLPFISVILGGMAGEARKNNKETKTYFIAMGMILVLQLLLNCKFYGLYDYILQFVLGFFVFQYDLSKHTKFRLPIKAILIGLLGVGILLYISYTKYSYSEINPFQYLLDRVFALQNHTFWGIDKLHHEGLFTSDAIGFVNELFSGFLSFDISRLNPNYGIARVMYMVSADTYARDMLSSGYLFAGSYLTVILSYVGYSFAFISSFILAFIVSKLCANLYGAILTKNYFVVFVYFYILKRYYEFFRVGNFAMILNWKFLVLYLFLFLMYIVSLRSNRNSRKGRF